MTGVLPRGAQLRRVTGSREAPDSSQNTITARRRRALRQILRPVLGHPAGDRLLVALDGAAGGALQPPAHAAQQLPGVAGMVAGPGGLLDHGGDAGKGPVVGVEAVGPGTLAQRLLQVMKLGVGQARGRPGGTAACQRLQPARLPAGVPSAGVLPGNTQLAGDLGLGVAGGEQRTGLHADGFEGLAVARTAGVAAVGGGSHAASLPGQDYPCHRNKRSSFNRLATRLVEISERIAERPETVPPPAVATAAGHEEDDKPGLVDLVAAGEEAMPRWQAVVEEFPPLLEEIGRLALNANEQ